MMFLPPAAQVLSQQGLPFRLFRHENSIASLEQAAQERGQRPQQVVRSLLFRLGEGKYTLVLMAGQQQVSWPILRKYFNQSRLSMASPEEVFEITGYQIGAVSPFGIPAAVRILADESVFLEDEISVGSGEHGLAIILQSAGLKQAIPALEIGLFAELK